MEASKQTPDLMLKSVCARERERERERELVNHEIVPGPGIRATLIYTI